MSTSSKIDDLVAHAEGLRGLARRLVQPEDAEDVVQDTWQRALQHPPRRNPAAWLPTVLRNVVRQRQRRERTRGAIPTPVPGVAPAAVLVAEHCETARRLAAALAGLAEPYRGAILDRYFEDLPFEAIALRTGVTPSTVRSRVHRGLALLRDDMIEGGRRPQTASALVLLAGLRSIPGGSTIAKGKVAVAAMVLAVVAAPFVAGWSGHDDETTLEAERSAARDVDPSMIPRRGASVAPGRPDQPERRATPVERLPQRRQSYLRIVLEADEAFASGGAEVELAVAEKVVRTLEVRDLGETATVSCSTELVEAESARVVVRHASGFTHERRFRYRELPAVSPDTAVLRVTIPEFYIIEGAIARPEVFRPDVWVGAFDWPVGAERPATIPTHQVRVAPRGGRFRFVLRGAGRWCIVAGAHGCRAVSVTVDARRPGIYRTAPLALQPGVSIAGVVRLNGEPCAGANVRAQRTDVGDMSTRLILGGMQPAWIDGRVRIADAYARADDAGRFEIGGLDVGSYRVRVQDGGEGQEMHAACGDAQVHEVRAPGNGVTFDLAATRLTIEAHGEQGLLTGAALSLVDRERRMWFRPTNPFSRHVVLVRPGTHYDLRVRHPAHPDTDRGVVVPHGVREQTVVVEMRDPATLPSLEITLDGLAEGELVPRLALRLDPVTTVDDGHTMLEAIESIFGPETVAERGSDGRYRAHRLTHRPGRYRLRAGPPGCFKGQGSAWAYVEPSVEIDLPPGGTGYARLRLVRGGRLSVEALSPAGGRLAARWRLLDERGDRVHVDLLDGAGKPLQMLSALGPVVTARPLPGGRYTVELTHAGYVTTRVEVSVAAGETRSVVATLETTP